MVVLDRRYVVADIDTGGFPGFGQIPSCLPSLYKSAVSHSDEIWPISVDLGSAVAHQIRPSSVKGGRYRSPQKCQNLPKIVFFLATGSRHNEHIQIKFGVQAFYFPSFSPLLRAQLAKYSFAFFETTSLSVIYRRSSTSRDFVPQTPFAPPLTDFRPQTPSRTLSIDCFSV